jgi:hypothetical protein
MIISTVPPGFVLVPYGDLEAIREAMTDEVVAVLLEPIQVSRAYGSRRRGIWPGCVNSLASVACVHRRWSVRARSNGAAPSPASTRVSFPMSTLLGARWRHRSGVRSRC